MSGIGLKIVEKLLPDCNSICVLDNDKKKIGEFSKLYSKNDKICFYHTDVSDENNVIKTLNDYLGKYPKIDCLINSAGILIDKPLVGLSLEKKELNLLESKEWDRVIKTNLYGVFYVSKKVIKDMVQNRLKGVVINIGSISSAGNHGQSSYAASKAAINALTVTWAQELSNFGIRVNCVAPGMTDTPMPNNAMSKEHLNHWEKKIPLRRFADPSEIADAVLFCIRNNYINGRTIEIDGGLRM